VSASTDERLDRIAAILGLAHREAISTAGEDIRSDPLSAAILTTCSTAWLPAAEVRTAVAKKNKAGTSTVTRRLAELVAQGALYHRGATATGKYRLSGLI
jgi:hypothetical protein